MVLHLARKLAATVLGQDPSDPSALKELEDLGVPVSDADCRSCADPCNEGHEDYGKRFDVDYETEMRGSIKPYRRQVLISTGKADWAHDIASVSGSLAKYISSSESHLLSTSIFSKHKEKEKEKEKDSTANNISSSPPKHKVAGVYPYPPSGRLSVLNGSHTSQSDDPDTHGTVLILPDYIVVSQVPQTPVGASALWKYALDPAVHRAGTVPNLHAFDESNEDEESLVMKGFKSWTLPYNCLILLCSHKKRDARCHIAALRLEADFTRELESEGWHVDTDIEDLSSSNPNLESLGQTKEEREAAALSQLQQLYPPSSSPDSESPNSTNGLSNGNGKPQEKKALILKNSHIGGHKFAGNAVIYFPQGSSIWYGRVSAHEVSSIVKNTITQGKILPPLLRGGLNIARPGCKSLLDW